MVAEAGRGRRGRGQDHVAADPRRGEEIAHRTAGPSHYDLESKHYDAFNEKSSAPLNRLIERILRAHGVRSVLDLACGTGSQVFWLGRRGFHVVGADINARMLRIARRKGAVELHRADMRTARLGTFDAAITISNAIGHLTCADFEKALRNIRANLKPEGLYLFDIYDRDYLLRGDNITRLSIDRQRDGVREIQYSTIDGTGVLASYTTYLIQRGTGPPREIRSVQTLQVYSPKDLRILLRRTGFEFLRQSSIDGSKLTPRTGRILTMART